MGFTHKHLSFAFLLFTMLFLACEKLESSNHSLSSLYTESPDSVYITQSKIYIDTILGPNSAEIYLKKFNNPVLEEDSPDPSIIRAKNGLFYLFATESGRHPNIPIFKSKDLVNWFYVTSAFSNETRPSSFSGNLWAPDINFIDGKYVLYYSMSRWGGEMDCGIGVATSDFPYGPFKDYARLFDSKEIGVQNSIDPFYFEDDEESYLFWGSFHGIFGIKLSKNGLSIAPNAKKFQIAGNVGEGTYIHKHDGYFYLFFSTGSCCSGASSTYRIMMGRSKSVEGPYYDQQGQSLFESPGSVFLQSNSFVAGPGHNAEFITDDNGDNWVLYHGYLREKPELNRILFMDKVYWDHDWPHIPDHSPSRSSEIPVIKDSQEKESVTNRIGHFLSGFHRVRQEVKLKWHD